MNNADDLIFRRIPPTLFGLWVACTLFSTLMPGHSAAGPVSLVALAAMVLFGLVHGARRFGDPVRPVDRQWTFAMPITATFIVVGWDLCQDPLGATIGQRWIYPHGGAYFGVPLSNFLGWFLVTWTIFQAFALYLATARIQPRPVEPGYWYQAAGFWAAIALQFPLLLLTMPGMVVQDPSGWTWRSSDILQTATITGIYTMLAAAVTSALVVARRGNRSGHD